MPSDKYTQAMLEAYASSPTDVFILNTLEISGGQYADVPPRIDPEDMRGTLPCVANHTEGIGVGTESFWVFLGEEVGQVAVEWSSGGVPDRFTIEYDGGIQTTGFAGDAIFNDDLEDLGYPPVETEDRRGFLYFQKTECQHVLVTVEKPLQGSGWWVTVFCPNDDNAPEGVDNGAPAVPVYDFFIVQATESYDLTLEDDSVQTFEPVGFNFKLPGQNDQGIQELSIEIDNVDRRIGDFVRAAALSGVPTVVKFRPYLSTDLTTPQIDPPLEMVLSDIKMTETKVTARASFADLVNLSFLTKLYTRKSFPSLGNT